MVTRIVVALAFVLLAGSAALGQTPEIQKQIEKKLGELRKEKSALEELLTQALKNNVDVRVAESKLRDADVELYRKKMQILEKVALLYYDIAAARAGADEAMSRFLRDKAAYEKGVLSAPELSASAAAVQKFKSDLAGKEAQMEFLTGKHTTKTAVDLGVQWLILTRPLHPGESHGANSTGGLSGAVDVAGISVPMADKIRKALDSPFAVGANEVTMSAGEILDTLRQGTKGVNVQANVKDLDAKASLQLSESVPLGAFYQWAEDQFEWRFIVRDYGIVATDRKAIPPGAALLLELWRKGKTEAGGK